LHTLLQTAAEHDAAFINLHGAPGEDGLIQAMLDHAQLPYQGAGPAASFLALHKSAAKQLFRAAGLLTPNWEFLPAPPPEHHRPGLAWPLFVKSDTGGSSLRLARVTDEHSLRAALREIFDAGEEALLEEAVEGQEVTCGILDREALPPILIRPPAGRIFDYQSKYAENGAEELCPAPLPEDTLRRVRETALAAHNILGIEGYSRSDFILRSDGALYILETNTLPGMTSPSLVPREAAVAGMGFGELIERLLALGIRRRSKRSRPCRREIRPC
jgi:D-alanine-D-alanine ligase